MKKEEKQQLINKIVEEYIENKDISINELSEKYNISCPTISKHIKERGIEIRKVNSKSSSLKNAILELNVSSVEDVSKKFGIDPKVLEASKTLAKSKLKELCIKLAIETYVNTDGYHRNIKSISKRFGINEKTLVKYLNLNNIPITKKSDFANCYEEAFDIIDTEEKAYWLGFMYADGYICKKEYAVGLGLSVKDIDHVKKFNEFLKYEHGMNISKTHQFNSKDTLGKDGNELMICSTEIRNEHLWTSLKNKGCVPHKSLILEFPDINIFSDKSLIYHFIRGYFDGDGSLGYYQHSKTNKNYEHSLNFVGTENFLMEVQKYLGIGFLMHKPNCDYRTYRLSYSTAKAVNAANLMYKNATIYLDRKYNIYCNYFAADKSGKNGEPCDGNTVLT